MDLLFSKDESLREMYVGGLSQVRMGRLMEGAPCLVRRRQELIRRSHRLRQFGWRSSVSVRLARPCRTLRRSFVRPLPRHGRS